MFAPYCRSCARRVLLGTRRIVQFSLANRGERPAVALRCFCGTVVDWDARPPAGGRAGVRPDVAGPAA